jgi:anti-sigma B factor antagonist
MEMQITNLENGIKQIKLIGRMDLKGTNEIDNSFTFATSSSKTPVLVDMSEVEFLASIGMRTLLSNARVVERRGGKMVLFKPQPLVREALTTAGFDRLIPMIDDFDLACSELKAVISE